MSRRPRPKARSFGCLLLLGVAVLFVWFSLHAHHQLNKAVRAELERLQQERREEQVANIREGGGNVGISDGKLVEMLLDDPTCPEGVTSIDFLMADLGDPRFRRIREFPNVISIFFYCCENADNVMPAAKDMPAIESLSFEVTSISDESMRSLAEFPCLKEVRFEQVMPDAKIETLRELIPEVEIEACLESEEAEYRGKFSGQETKESE